MPRRTALLPMVPGFDRWLQGATQGNMQSLRDLSKVSADTRKSYMRAYAFGLDRVGEMGDEKLSIEFVDG